MQLLRGGTNNSVFVIAPRKENGVWVFDDISRGLKSEPLVGDTNKVVDILLFESHIRETDRFNLFFAASQPPDSVGVSFKAELKRTEQNWSVYECCRRECPLCPALLKYFNESPKTLFVWVSQ